MTRRPAIGLTCDAGAFDGATNGRARPAAAHYFLRTNYLDCICEAGGLPFALPHEPDLVDAYLDGLDGLLVTGGAFDIDPVLFGATTRHPSVTTKPRRTSFELAAVRAALARRLPLFGICGGMQLLNVARGGTLIQHIPDFIEDALDHEQPNPPNESSHDISVCPGTRLERILGSGRVAVNSTHHQAVAQLGRDLVVSAKAPDGVVEAIELPNQSFCLGVQWHPEYLVGPGDRALFAAFVDAARG